MKKFFSLVLALVMALSLTTVAWGAEVTVADTAAAQAALDAAADGTTIKLTAGVNYGTLYVRPTAGNGTEMYCKTHDYTTTNAEEFKTHLADGQYHYTPYYTTALDGVTIVGAEGATIEGFVISSGHVVGPAYDYVRDYEKASGSLYYSTLYISNLTFKNVNFTGKVNINTSDADTVYDGVTFDGCTFTTGGTASSNGQAIRYYNEANNGNVKNIVVNDCTFTNCFQGVYVHHVNGVSVTDSSFDTTGHNAIAIQSHAGAVDTKDVVITGNTFNKIGSYVIRFNEIGDDSTIAINNNIMVDSGANGVMIKAESVDSAADIDLESNYWDGKDADSGVIAAGLEIPAVYYTTYNNGVLGGLTGVASAPASAAKGAYFTANLSDLSVHPSCNLSKYTYTLESYTAAADVAKTFATVAIWQTDKITGAKAIVDTAVVASADSANLAFVNGASITYLNTNVTTWTATATAVATVDVEDAEKCGDVFIAGDVAVYKDAADKVYYEDIGGTAYNVGGNLVLLKAATAEAYPVVDSAALKAALAAPAAGTVYTVAHDYDCDYTTFNGKKTVTKVYCAECDATFAFVAGKVSDAIAKFGAGNYLPTALVDAAGTVYVSIAPNGSVGGTVVTPSTDKVVQSAETFDAGIAMYVGMSVLAATGSAVVIGKKKD